MMTARRGSSARTLHVVMLLALLVPGTGCTYHVAWPEAYSAAGSTADDRDVRSYQIDGAKLVNYRQHLAEGHVVSLDFAGKDGSVGETVDWRSPDPGWPHFVMILDGTPYGLVKQMYEEGRFRLFQSPVRMASTFPAMTDLALSRILQTPPCRAVESLYFDRQKNAMSNANDAYLKGENAPWLAAVDYAAPQSAAIKAYLDPSAVFHDELRAMHRLFSKKECGTTVGYSLGTAGMGTRRGEAGMRHYLLDIDKLCERLVFDHRGRVRISILADHGQTRQPCEMVDFKKALTLAGLRVGKSLKSPQDVVRVRYGVVTAACFYTQRPAEVARVLLEQPSVDLAAWPEGDAVVVQNAGERAVIRRGGAGYIYDDSRGDPLQLKAIVTQLRSAGHVQGDGVIEDRPLLIATAEHVYPDPLHRVWECFHGLVVEPPDLVVSLKQAFCHGSDFFHFFIRPVTSTHGDLGRASSESFILSTAWVGSRPEVLRVEDAAEAIGLPSDR